MSLYQQVREIVLLNRDIVKIVWVYSGCIALLSLIVPIAIQSLTNVVSFGVVIQPLVVLTIMVFLVLSVVAGVRIAQAIVVENLQQRVFTQLGVKLARHLPLISLVNFDEYRVSELVNRFFEVQTIQKSVAVLLITGIEIFILSIASMTLIAFYHPLLLSLDFLLIFLLIIAVAWPWKKALRFAIAECGAKHQVGAWLEEIVHNIFLFKLQQHADYALNKVDEKICDYLKFRQAHFRNILKHLCSMNAIYVIINTLLLGMGGYLVVQGQLSLGQLVASELIINALLSGFVRMSYYLEDLYDLLASCEKLTRLLHIPCEHSLIIDKQHDKLYEDTSMRAPLIEAQDLTYQETKTKAAFSHLNFTIEPNDKVVVFGDCGSSKTLVSDVILGLRTPDSGVLRINNMPIQDYDINYLRQYSALARNIELFSGTIYENLIMQRDDITLESIHQLLYSLRLHETMQALPKGLDTFISGSHMTMSSLDLLKLMLVRAFLTKPSLLIIDDILDYFPESDLNAILEHIKDYPATVIMTTGHKEIADAFSKVVTL